MSDRRKTNRFDNKLAQKKMKKDYSSSFFRTKAKTKEIDLKKDEVLTLLVTTSK